jgi:PAS domain S-box-containing protein
MVIDPATGEHTWQGVIVDLTAAKRSEDELRRSEERYRTLVEQVPAIVYEMGPDDERHTLYVSPHVEAILGYSRAEWLEQPDIWMELLDEEDRETELAAHDLHTTTRDPWDREYRLIASDGRRVWVRDQATLVQDPATGQARWYGVMLDLTAQKSAEEALRHANDDLELRVLVRTAELEEANEMLRLEVAERRRVEAALREAQQRYRDLVEDLPAVVYSLTTNWSGRPDSPDETVSLPYMSPAIEELVGFTPDEWQQPGFWRSRLHPHDRDRVCALADRSAATGEPFIAEYRFLAKDGRVVWVLDRATLRARDAQGLPAYFQGVMLDVTPRKEAEAKAEAAEERYRQLTERGPSATFVFRLRHGAVDPIEVEYVSPQVAEVIGHPLDHFRTDAARWFDIVHPDDRERVGASLRRAIDTGDPWALEYRIIRVDGSIAWLRNEARLVERDELGRPSAFQGALLDVSAERKPMEEIAASEVQLRSLIEGLHGIPWIQEIDPETDKERFTYIGAQSVDLLGYTPEELIAEPRHFSRMVHPDDRATVERMSARSRRTGIWEGTFRIVARDGSVKRLRGLARRTVTEDGRHLWHGLSAEVGPTLTPEDEAREHAQAGTGAASPEGRPSRPPVGGSPAER